jgi:hypothetical protein
MDLAPVKHLYHSVDMPCTPHGTGSSAFADNIGYCRKVDYGKISIVSAHSGNRQKLFYPIKLAGDQEDE